MKRSAAGRMLRGLLALILLVLLLPYALVPAYRIVDPVSTLMLWRWAKGARVERTFVPLAFETSKAAGTAMWRRRNTEELL